MKKFIKGLGIVLLTLLVIGVTVNEVEKYQERKERERIVNIIKEKEMLPRQLIQKKLDEALDIDRRNNEYRDYLLKQWATPEYKEWKKVREIKEAYGIESYGYTTYTMELSFYSDLNCENGYGNLTASGKTLKAGMVANNFLSFGTKVYMEGHGMKTVEDRGSKRYFHNVKKFDVLVPRNSGESESAYLRRVNNMGRVKVTGYIF